MKFNSMFYFIQRILYPPDIRFWQVGFLCFAFSMNLNAQWIQQNSNTTNVLRDVHFPVQDTGYVVGDDGIILRTINGGINWQLSLSGTSKNLRAVYFTNAITGYAVGDSGTILKTVNGGNDWFFQSPGLIAYNTDIFFTDNQTGYIVGDASWPYYGILLQTTDGGNNWDTILTDHGMVGAPSIHFPTADTGYMVGAFYNSALRTTDGGATWSYVWTPAVGVIETVYFTDANTGYIGGWYGPTLIKTTDGGTNWLQVNQFQPDSTYMPGLFSIDFPDDNIGYGVGWQGAIVKTTDAGNNWTKQTLDLSVANTTLYSVYFTDINTGYIVGDSGVILKTANGGEPVGIEKKIVNKNEIKFYPNPVGNEGLNISYNTTQMTFVHLVLTDYTGKEVLTINKGYKPVGKYIEHIDTSPLVPGMYFLIANINGQIQTNKVIKL